MAVIGGKTDFTADVFDFFDTPRDEDNRIQENIKPRKSTGNSDREPQKPSKHDAFRAQKSKARNSRRSRGDSDSSHSSDSDISDIETDSVASYKSAERVKNDRSSPGVVVKGEAYSDDSFTDSSSAYSDESTDDEEDIIETERERFRQKNESKESKSNRPSDLQVHKTPVQEADTREAWSNGGGIRKVEVRPPRSDMGDQNDQETHVPNRSRPKSSKPRNQGVNTNERLFRERSKSGSDSEMTDVSPLSSPKQSPRSHNGHNHVQYDDVPNIKLENKQLDLSVLMDAVQEIEREQQRNERLKINSRRVMFAPPKGKQISEHGNFTYDQNRAKTIEKENQRLLKEIMKHVGPNKKKQIHKVPAEPYVQRLTPSAVNRKRDQRRIESENLQMLRRLQTTHSTRGMSRDEQLTDYKRTVLYGVPVAAVQPYEGTMGQRTRSLTSVFSSTTNSTMRSRRSRPGSAKSTASTLRPGSAKSIGSLRPGSAKSVRSICSTTRMGSAKSVDNRPAWNDRFSYT